MKIPVTRPGPNLVPIYAWDYGISSDSTQSIMYDLNNMVNWSWENMEGVIIDSLTSVDML